MSQAIHKLTDLAGAGVVGTSMCAAPCTSELECGMQNLHRGVLRDEALYNMKREEQRQLQLQQHERTAGAE